MCRQFNRIIHMTGVYATVNVYKVISGVRHLMQWACQNVDRSKRWFVQELQMQEECRTTVSRFLPEITPSSFHGYWNMHTEQPLLWYLLSLAHKNTSRWSTCPEKSCQGNLMPEDCIVFCHSCRRWYHAACLPLATIKPPTYFICKLCALEIIKQVLFNS